MTLRKLHALSAMVITALSCLHIAKATVLSTVGALFSLDTPTAYKASHEQPQL